VKVQFFREVPATAEKLAGRLRSAFVGTACLPGGSGCVVPTHSLYVSAVPFTACWLLLDLQQQ
jgi:hypothetical protein